MCIWMSHKYAFRFRIASIFSVRKTARSTQTEPPKCVPPNWMDSQTTIITFDSKPEVSHNVRTCGYTHFTYTYTLGVDGLAIEYSTIVYHIIFTSSRAYILKPFTIQRALTPPYKQQSDRTDQKPLRESVRILASRAPSHSSSSSSSSHCKLLLEYIIASRHLRFCSECISRRIANRTRPSQNTQLGCTEDELP